MCGDVDINSPSTSLIYHEAKFRFRDGRTYLAPYGVPSRMPVYNKESAEANAEARLPGQVVMKSNEKS